MNLAGESQGTRRLFSEYEQEIWQRTDRMFLWLLAAEWLAAVVAGVCAAPLAGGVTIAHLPLPAWKGFVLGGAIVSLPIQVARKYPGSKPTRHEVALAQGLIASLLLHLTGGAPITSYVIFASLAFLAMYREISLLLLVAFITTLDHLLGCFFWPRSIYGAAHVAPWFWLRHTAFVGAEVALLYGALRKSRQDLLATARKQATIDASQRALEREVSERQRTEQLLSLQYVITRLLAASNTLHEAAPLLLRIVGENQRWQLGELWEVDETGTYLGCVEIWQADQRSGGEYAAVRRAMKLLPDVGLPGRVWYRKLPLWVPDLTAEASFPLAAFRTEASLRGAFAIPLRNGAQVIGVMAFYSDGPREPNDDHLSMISGLGGQIGQFMERKRVERGLKASEDRYRSVIAALDEGILLIDGDARVLTANASAERILGRPANRMIGQLCAETFAGTVDEDGHPVAGDDLPFVRSLRAGEPLANIVLAIERDGQAGGERTWISVNAQPLRHAPQEAPHAALASFSDISARKLAEESLLAAHAELETRVDRRTKQLSDANQALKREVEERERAQRELHLAKEAADTASQAKSGFLASMSHELRTPLNAVIGFSELLEQEIFGPLNDKQRSYVGNVLISGRHLLGLVNDILDISKVEAGRMDLVCEATPIGALVDVARSVIAAMASKKGIELQVDVPDDLPVVSVDPGRIKQVLYNLISNAIKFTAPGGTVRVGARLAGDRVQISVADTGVGIAPEHLSRLFREFEQLPQRAGARPEGTGLGLALTKRLVELHGGTVEVESEPGKGSTFSVFLPLLAPEESAPADSSAAAI
ncbi:MAG TPA: ATP-binding protein [Polyangia bacterium]|nr:ATP-binding protein [Polyangia bacterium]